MRGSHGVNIIINCPYTDENATNLVHALLGLQDNYDIPQFDTKRQAALSALVFSSPRLAAP